MATSTTRTYAATPGDIPPGTLTQLFFHAIDDINKADALREKVDGRWRSISHAQVLEQVRRATLGL